MGKGRTLVEKHADAVFTINALRRAIIAAENGAATWGGVLSHEVRAAESAMKAVRAVVRARATAEKRKACKHDGARRGWNATTDVCSLCRAKVPIRTTPIPPCKHDPANLFPFGPDTEKCARCGSVLQARHMSEDQT